LQQTQNLDNFGGRLNASVVVHSDSEDAQVSVATRERNSRVRIVKGDMYFVKESGMTKNVIRITEFGGLDLNQQYLEFRGDNFDADIRVHILHKGIERVPMIRKTVENLDNIFQVRVATDT
jgi:hypothetical protein